MNSSAIIISAAILLAWFALAVIGCTIDSFGRKKYKQYIDSIKIGDKFMMRGSFDEDVNPFEERRKPIIVEIIDIKTNEIGEKYVQYRDINDPPNLAFNNKIDIFTKLYVRCND